MKELYIIGNGFDIYHKMNTSYNDFREYLINCNSPVYKKVDKCLYYEIENDKSNVWNKFEYNLRNLDEDYIVDECSALLMGYGDPDWRDSGHQDYQYCIDEITTCLTVELLKEFTRWIKISNSKLNGVLPKVKLNRNAKFLSFNYTMTLEDVYKIEPYKILHIHNSVEDEAELILGHNYSDGERCLNENKSPYIRTKDDIRSVLAERALEEYDVRYSDGKNILRSYYELNYKNSNNIISMNSDFFSNLTDIDRIYILGHSMSDVDMVYIFEILKNVDRRTHWYLTWHSVEDKQNIEEFIYRTKIENYSVGKITDTIFSFV